MDPEQHQNGVKPARAIRRRAKQRTPAGLRVLTKMEVKVRTNDQQRPTGAWLEFPEINAVFPFQGPATVQKIVEALLPLLRVPRVAAPGVPGEARTPAGIILPNR